MPQTGLDNIFGSQIGSGNTFQSDPYAEARKMKVKIAYDLMMQKNAKGASMYSPTEAEKIADYMVSSQYGVTPDNLVTPKLSAQQQLQMGKISSGLSALEELKPLTSQINTQDFGPFARLQGLARGFMGNIGLDPVAYTYQDLVPAVSRNLVKALGDSGALSDYDVSSVGRMLPAIGDSKEEADIKMNFISRVLNQGIKNLNSQRGQGMNSVVLSESTY